MKFKTSMLRSDLCHCSDVYIVAKRDLIVRKATVRTLLTQETGF